MAVVRFFAQARDVTGVSSFPSQGNTVQQVLDEARALFGDPFERVLATATIWVNGEPATSLTALGATDELAILPPVSGGAC